MFDRPLTSTTPSIAPSTIIDIKTTGVPWFLAYKVILWFHRCQRLLRTPSISHRNLSISDRNSMTGLESRGFGDRPWFQ
jgi:hypothetical protein